MYITVSICTWNRCDLLEQTLTQMTRAVVPPGLRLEVLVIANACTDNTEAVASSFTGRLPIRTVVEPTPGLSRARNRALAEAQGDYIVFTDDDVLVSEQWLPSLAEAIFRFPDAAAFGGTIEPWFPVEPDQDLVEAFPALSLGFCGLDNGVELGVLPDDKQIFGANMAFSVRAVAGLRFNPQFGPVGSSAVNMDEIDFVARLRQSGGSVVWVPAMRVQHYVDPKRMTRRYLLKFSRDAGRAWVRFEGIPEGKRILFPLWLIRQCAKARVSAMVLGVKGKRVASLEQLRTYSFYLGAALESFERSRSSSSP